MNFDFKAFKSISDEGDRFEYALKNLKFLGEGGSRTVFQLNSQTVLKIAHTDKGKKQNATETAISSDANFSKIVTRVYEHAADFSWIISERVSPLESEEEVANLSGVSWEDFINFISGRTSEKNSSLSPFRELVSKKKLHFAELMDPQHWGESADGRLVILDYGVAESVIRGRVASHINGQYSSENISETNLVTEKLFEIEELKSFISEVIKKCGDDWCLYTKGKKGGKRRRLGTHKTKKDAINQEIAINYSKKNG